MRSFLQISESFQTCPMVWRRLWIIGLSLLSNTETLHMKSCQRVFKFQFYNNSQSLKLKKSGKLKENIIEIPHFYIILLRKSILNYLIEIDEECISSLHSCFYSPVKHVYTTDVEKTLDLSLQIGKPQAVWITVVMWFSSFCNIYTVLPQHQTLQNKVCQAAYRVYKPLDGCDGLSIAPNFSKIYSINWIALIQDRTEK